MSNPYLSLTALAGLSSLLDANEMMVILGPGGDESQGTTDSIGAIPLSSFRDDYILVTVNEQITALQNRPGNGSFSSPVTMTVAGVVTGSVAFDGSENFTLNLTMPDNSIPISAVEDLASTIAALQASATDGTQLVSSYYSNLNASTQSSIQGYWNASTSNTTGLDQFGTVLQLASDGTLGPDSSNYVNQLLFGTNGTLAWRRNVQDGAWTLVTLWHSGNLTPSNYVQSGSTPTFAGMSLTGAFNGTSISISGSIVAGTTSPGYLIVGPQSTGNQSTYFRADGTMANAEAGTPGTFYEIWNAGNFTPGNYLPLTGGTLTTSGATVTLNVQDTGSNGGNLKITGNGSTTPSKTIRVVNGVLQFVNSAYSAVIGTMDDSGNFATNGTHSATQGIFSGGAPLQFTGASGTGTVFIWGSGGSGDNICSWARVGSADYNFTQYGSATIGSTLTVNSTLTVGGTATMAAINASGQINANATTAVYATWPVATGGIANGGNGGNNGLTSHANNNGGSSATSCAAITFIRDSQFGCYLGIDTTNDLRIGGWSFGNNAYQVAHSGLSSFTFAGTVSSVGVANFNTSDRRLKKNIVRQDPRPLHRTLKWYSYDRRDIEASGLGPLAQDVQKTEELYVQEYDHYLKDTGGKTVKRLTIDKSGIAMEEAMWAGKELDRLVSVIERLEKRLARTEAELRKFKRKKAA